MFLNRTLTTLMGAISLSLISGLSMAADVRLDRPSGGWVYSPGSQDPAPVTYAYPNNLIDRGGQRNRTLIEGQLKAAGRDQRKPPALVVNGNPMPLYTGQDGRFARPYAFGPGSNSIEIKGNGVAPKRVQFYEANNTRLKAKVRVILAWDDPQAEVDLHVVTPDGQHAFFANPVLTNGGGLDVDSVDGAGPEMFSMVAPQHGTYQIFVNYWGNFGTDGYHFDESTRQQDVITCRIGLVFNENTSAERRETFVVPLRKIGDLVAVRSFKL